MRLVVRTSVADRSKEMVSEAALDSPTCEARLASFSGRQLRRIGSRVLRLAVTANFDFSLILAFRSRSGVLSERRLWISSNCPESVGVILPPRVTALELRGSEFGVVESSPADMAISVERAYLPRRLLRDDGTDLVELADGFLRPAPSKSQARSIVEFLSASEAQQESEVPAVQSLSVFITVDTEDTYFDRPHMMTGAELGIPSTFEIAEALSIRGLKGIFFVNVYEQANYSDPRPVSELMAALVEQGHEVGLHCHPSPNLDFYDRQITEYDLGGQKRILEFGKEAILKATGIEPVSFRAGGYIHDRNTLVALKALNFKIDSSYLHGVRAPYADGGLCNPYRIDDDLFEVPVTYVPLVHGRGGWKHSKLDVNWLSGDELAMVCRSAAAGGKPLVNFMMHSFSFMKKYRFPNRNGITDVGTTPIARSPKNLMGSYVEIHGEIEGLFGEFLRFLDFLADSDYRVPTFMEDLDAIRFAASGSGSLVDSAEFLYRGLS